MLTPQVAEAVSRACSRSAAVVHEDLKLGLNGLATVVCVAPLLGLFGTQFGIVDSFVGCGCEKTTLMAAEARGLSTAMWPTALGLLVGLIALWFYRYLLDRLETMDHDMASARLDLVNQLGRYRGRWDVDVAAPGLPLFRTPASGVRWGRELAGWGAGVLVMLTSMLIFCWCVIRVLLSYISLAR